MRTLLLSCLLFTASAFAQTPAPIAAAVFFQRPAVVEAKLSPGGKRVAIRTALGGDRYTLGVLDLTDGLKAYRPASFSDADVMEFAWVGDDRLVFNGWDLHDYAGEAGHRAPGLYTVTFDGKRPRMLVNSTNPFITDGSDNALPYNHELLMVPQPQEGVQPDEAIIANIIFEDREVSDLLPMWLNTRTGIARDLDTGHAPQHVMHWWFDGAGHARAAYTENKRRGSYYWRGPQDAEWRVIAQDDALSMPFHVLGVADTGELYVTETSGPGHTEVLKRFDFTTMKPESKPMLVVPGFDFRGQLLQGKPGGPVLGVRVQADAEHTFWLDPTLQELQRAVDAKLPGHVNRISCAHCGQPDMVALIRSFSDRDPGTLYVFDAATKKLRPLLQTLKGIDPGQMATVDFQRIKARDGHDLPVWLTIPAGTQPGQPRPVVVMAHGGPWVRIGEWEWNAMNQFLASRGYLVIEPEFRGSTGYGGEHYHAGWKQWGQGMEDDLADALLWAQKQGLAKQGKACIAGASYGGYAALMGPVRFPELFSCAVAWAGVADLDLFLQGNWWVSDDLSDSGRSYYLPELVGDVKQDAAMLRANNPVLLADRMKSPVMLVYGEADLRVPLAHGKRMRDALRAAGNPPEWFTYPGEGHGWTNPQNQVDFAEKMAAFLGRNLH
ncbi:MAG: S9 family peptidase [Paucibacter sp.]|nr:S9 family peptidase [Roseateles sp.]